MNDALSGLMRTMRSISLLSALVLTSTLGACAGDDVGENADDITDVKHTDVERQSIGNCWLYAEASWVESMNLSATGEAFDISQSYWTYFHWYDQITSYVGKEIQTGGYYTVANEIIMERGLMPEGAFVAEDEISEMSNRQAKALDKINTALSTGKLKDREARRDRALVREVMDDAWGLTDEVRAQLDATFGADDSRNLRSGASTEGTKIIAPYDFPVVYAERTTDQDNPTFVETTIDQAIASWVDVSYPSWGYGDLTAERREFQIRVQRALHDAQPVIITWDVDFNAMEGSDPELVGSFNLTTLERAGGPGRQGGHMTVLEDYQAITVDHGLLAAGVTLDPIDDANKLAALLEPSTEIVFWRIKNSWGALRDDRASAPGFPGYHDLYQDYLDGPIRFCPSVDNKTDDNCTQTTVPLSAVVLPPGY